MNGVNVDSWEGDYGHRMNATKAAEKCGRERFSESLQTRRRRQMSNGEINRLLMRMGNGRQDSTDTSDR